VDDIKKMINMVGSPSEVASANRPITIRVGYGWPKRDGKSKADDHVWAFIRERIKVVSDSLSKTQVKRGGRAFACHINRLRAMHGGSVLDVLLQRIKEADILVFDITGLNPNVLVEIGMALAMRGCGGRVFVFQEVDDKDKPIECHKAHFPSDLNGYFFTRYRTVLERGRPTFRLTESQAFVAALRSQIMDAARTRGIWRDAAGTSDDEDEIGKA
jgi:hypothetical protein